MKRQWSTVNVQKRRSTSLQPSQVALVGNSGKIRRDNRLRRLRMTRKYNNFLLEQEYEERVKISQMSQLVEKYENLSCLIQNIEQENADHSNEDILQELEQVKATYRKRLLHLESMLDSIPDTLKRSMQEIFHSKFNRREKAIRGSLLNKKKTELKHPRSNTPITNIRLPTDRKNSINERCKKTNTKSNEAPSVVTSNSWSHGCFKSQIFVRRSNSQLEAINIDLFSLGKDLYHVLAEELEGDATVYNVMFGAKKVDKEKTLFEQEIYHGSTVELILPMYGGMERKKKRNKRAKKHKETTTNLNKERSLEKTPESLTKRKVQDWLKNATNELNVDDQEVTNLASLNGKALTMLAKEDWIRRSPNYGDILFNMWKEYEQTFKNTDGNKTHDQDNLEGRDSLLPPEEEKKEEVFNTVNDLDNSRPNMGFQEEDIAEDTSMRSRKVRFGEVETLDEIGESLLLEDLGNDGKSPIPEFGTTITVTGVCDNAPLILGNVGTIFITDDPPGAASIYYKLKIAVTACEKNKELRPDALDDLLNKIRTNMHMSVKGRVERLDEEDVVLNDVNCEMLKFKLVIDSDDHALVYVQVKLPKLTRQLSQPWWPQKTGSENSNEWNLEVGEVIVETDDFERVYCDSTVSDEELLKYVVAFKNSFDGNIFVGAEKDGKITGMQPENGELAKWSEKISKAIGNILPEANEGAAICENIQEAIELVNRKRCFVCVLPLCQSKEENNENSRAIGWIHVPKGEFAKVYFTKATDVHVFKRIGAENKRITNYPQLFNDLESLGSRQIEPFFEEELDGEDDKQDQERCKSQDEYKVLTEVERENQQNELKMIFGDKPLKTIQDRYLAQYACGFLNSDGGSIFFGVQEDEQSKKGHIVGILMSAEEKKGIFQAAVRALSNFYPPVSTSQFHITFNAVVVPSDYIVISGQTQSSKGKDKNFAVITCPSDEIGRKWPNFIEKKLPGRPSAVIPIRSQRFCVVVATKRRSIRESLTGLVEQFVKENPKCKLNTISETELNTILKHLNVIQLKISRSPYPVHMIKAIDTYVFSKDKMRQLCRSKLTLEGLMDRFKLDLTSEFNVDKFLKHVKNFDNAGNSYLLVTSPFDLPEKERDLYGLVIPKWTLTIDLDQQPKQTGHLYQLFQKLNDRHQTERDRFLTTPQATKLDLNPDHGICWLAARGYHDDEKTLSEESHLRWNRTHRSRLRNLLEAELRSSMKPNCVNVIVLWDEGHLALVESLRTILEDIISWDGDDNSTEITFVCATHKARSDISKKIIEPLQDDNWDTISEDRIYVAPPYVLARFLSLKLPSPYRPEDDYQVPHKKNFLSGGSQTIPQILHQRLRQNISGYLKVMYMKTGLRKPDERKQNEERRNFFAGSEITNDALHGNIAIRRTNMDALEKVFRILSGDKKAHVSLIFVKVDRGAGSTTMCLQFLFQQHKNYPCAQLIEIRDGLVSHIEDINKVTKLPLILLVDEEIAHLQDFLDFKKEVERKNVNVIFLLIEPAERISVKPEPFVKPEPSVKEPTRKQSKYRTKSARDSSLYAPSPYKVVELRRKLDENEMDQLIQALTVLPMSNEKKRKLLKLKEDALKDKEPRTFAHFGLTAFGRDYKGLKQYVKFRLGLADANQQNILAFLSLIHVFTDYSLSANALVHLLNKNNIVLEKELGNKYLQELLSPRIDDSDSRRMSFLEVAQEILLQLSETTKTTNSVDDLYWQYIKSVSVEMAKLVLSKYITTKKMDRLTRKLFVTSEYESEKFSLLIRSMKDKNPDTARDTLEELVKVFENHSPIRAHLLAHLAKYYMTVYKKFKKAESLIEEAVHEQNEDSLLRHIHGDIIRQYVVLLKDKMKKKEEMETILSFAIKSSECFQFVRTKQRHMSHGYVSDAMLRITVMQAGIKLVGGHKNMSFVDYLVQRIDEIKNYDDFDISPNSRYLLSLIPDAHQYLDVIDFEHKEKWKESFLDCLGDLSNLTRLCEKINDVKSESSFIGSSAWLHQIVVETQILYHALEIEYKVLSPQEIEFKLTKMEEYGSLSKLGDRFMKFWIRYSRQRLTVPNLQIVRKKVNEWSTKMRKKGVASPQADFYNYVVHVLIALKDPTISENMDTAEKLLKRQQCKKYSRKEDFILPLEWLHPKKGHDIESIDSLLHHDDLIKDTNISSKSDRRKPIEGSLFEKNITQWEGTITAIRGEWQGIITLERRLPVRFVPQNARPSMPSLGDTVKFCLSFDGFGLNAWGVVRPAGSVPSDLSDIANRDDDSLSEHSEEEENDLLVAPSLCSIDIPEPEEPDKGWNEDKAQQLQYGAVSTKGTRWHQYKDQRMQGVVWSNNPEKGFGFIKRPKINEELFFHASQLRIPVTTFEGNIFNGMLLEFKVEILPAGGRTRATDICVLEDEDLRKSMMDSLQKKSSSSPSTSKRVNKSLHVAETGTGTHTSRQEGSVVELSTDHTYGFIKLDHDKSGKDIFFHRNSLTTKGLPPKVGDRVRFSVKNLSEDRTEATDILLQSKSISNNRWDGFIGAGIQEGFVNSTTDDGGTINSSKVTGPKSNLQFRYKDICNKPSQVVDGMKMHFEVQKRGGKCTAVRIYIIDTPEIQAETSSASNPFQ